MKPQKELTALKNEVETLNKKLHELTDEELEQVTGGAAGGNNQKDRGGKKKLRHGVKNNNAAENVSEVISYSVTPI